MKDCVIKQKSLPKWPIITAGILTFLYFYTLHPITGFLGGLVFTFIGFWTPSAVNILISYWLVSCWLRKFSVQKVVLTTVVSAILGLNIFLLSPIIGAPKYVTVNVVKPLIAPNENDAFKYGKTANENLMFNIQYFNDSNATVEPFIFSFLKVGGDEGCGCMYFNNIDPLYTDGSIHTVFNDYLTAVVRDSTTKSSSHNGYVRYKITSNIKPQGKKDLFEVFIQDNHGGNVVVSAYYPQFLYVSSVREYGKEYVFPDKDFTIHALNVFLYDNFWVNGFRKYFQAPLIIDKHFLLKHPEIWETKSDSSINGDSFDV